jgi:putative transposase
MPEIQRKAVRLPGPYYLGFRAYFVTICAKARRKLFATSEIVESSVEVLRQQSQRFLFGVQAYCFMPDHCHFLLAGKAPAANLSEMVRGLKGCSAKGFRQFGVFDAWQKGFYEHIVRSSEDCGSVTAYIFENPVRAGLAEDIYGWPISGSFVFEWREFQRPAEIFVPPYKDAEKRVGSGAGGE